MIIIRYYGIYLESVKNIQDIFNNEKPIEVDLPCPHTVVNDYGDKRGHRVSVVQE